MSTAITFTRKDAANAAMERAKGKEAMLGRKKTDDTFLAPKMSLSLCMITKNEEQFLERCINSVKPAVDEIIVVDTGSTDRTKEIAKALGATVLDFAWGDDFSKARNFAIEHATGDWILVLDADEVLDAADAGKIKEMISDAESQGIDAYSFITKNFSNNFKLEGWRHCSPPVNGFYGWHGSKKTRLFRNRKGYHFDGEIHELVDYSILAAKGVIKLSQIPILHFQRQDKQKIDYYMSLGEKKARNNPKNAKAHLDFANQNRIVGNNQIAIEEFNKAVFLSKQKGSFYVKANLGLGAIYLSLNELDKAKGCFENILLAKPDNADAHLNLGNVFFKMNDLANAEQSFKKCLTINEDNVLALVNLGAVYDKQGKYAEAISMLDKSILLNPHNPDAFFNLGVAYGRLSDYETALKTLVIAFQKGYPEQEKLMGMINFAKQQIEKDQKDYGFEFRVK